jgi:hypothetical protein
LLPDAQVHAPLLDLNSPFDDNLMLTADIAEEAKRLMMNLEGMLHIWLPSTALMIF